MSINNHLFYGLLFILIVHSSRYLCDAKDPISISQISPKSSTIDNFNKNNHNVDNELVTIDDNDDDDHENVLILKGNNIESSSLPEIIMQNDAIIKDSNKNINKILTTITETETDPIEIITHDRVERSASPILNDISSKNINSLNSLNDYHSDVDEDGTNSASAGHYYNLIKPTSTSVNRPYDEIGEITHNNQNNNNNSNNRFGKELSLDSFLSKGGPVRPLKSDGPLNQQQQQQLQLLINPTSVTSMMGLPIATNNHHDISSSSVAAASPNGARQQNPNPDIQDIITGIVKLLNGNVNVHANTQPTSRRPYTTRINNRGPPRISEAQPIPPSSNDGYGGDQLSSSNRPQHHQHAPPYPFDRPDVPIRPFLQGVPIPEQIVPSMQQNYRPGFISQNRPPWQRPRPRPPITTNRRPIPPYKPIPTLPEYQITQQQQSQQHQQPQQPIIQQQQQHHPQQSQQPQLHQLPYHHQQNIDDIEDNLQQMLTTTESDTTFNETQLIEQNNNATDDYINVNFDESADDSTDDDDLLMQEEEPSEIPMKKDELALKKKDKMSEHKNKLSNNNNNNNIAATSTQLTPTTIIQSTSEINTLQYISSTMTTITSHPILLNPSENFETSKLESSINYDDDADIHMFNSQTINTPQLAHTTLSSSTSSSSSSSSSSSTSSTSSKSTSTSLEMSSAIPSIKDSVSSTTVSPFIITTSSSQSILSTASTLPTQNLPYHPRPGIVLDDPEFKPGGGGRPSPAINRLPTLGGLPPAAPPPPYHAQRPQQIQPTRQQLPPGYGEIFDVTLSAIQGPGSGSGGQQTIRIKPYQNVGSSGSGYGGGVGGIYGQTGDDDIIVSPAGDDGFVSIDGKRTYINLFGESTDIETPFKQQSSSASINPTKSIGPQSVQQTKDVQNIPTGITGTGYAIVETEIPPNAGQKHSSVQSTIGNQPSQSVHRPPAQPHFRPRPQQQQPPVRIDTCIVGDDSTCDQTQNEKCKTESGVSSCHCRPGFGRRIHREPCRKVVSFLMSLRVDKIYDKRIQWDNQLADMNSEPHLTLSYEASRAIDSAMSMTPFSDEFMNARVNKIYNGDASQGAAGVFVNVTLQLEENGDTIRPTVKSDIQKHLLGVIHRRNNNIGNSVLYVDSPQGSISNLQDLDECTSDDLNDCHTQAVCTNVWGSYRCECELGYRDPWYDQPQRAGRECHTCPETYCNNRGTCSYDENGSQQICTCFGSYYGQQCEIDGEVLGVAIGASIAAVIIIVLTLICLVMWSRRWHREQKNSMGSPVFGYMNTAALQVKTPVGGGGGLSLGGGPTAPQPYQVTLEDRMRWAQIADVMSQSNHYAAEPTSPSTRPSSAMFGYPNLQLLGNAGGNNGGGSAGGNLSMMGTLPMQQQHHHHSQSGTLPPVPMPRLGLRSNGIRQLENSSSSEEEDRADLLGRNFQVPRPKSRSTNGSIANQSVIYYDVDYEPSGGGGGGGVHDLYGGTQTTTLSNQIPGPQGIPMSTYTSGRAPSMYYVK